MLSPTSAWSSCLLWGSLVILVCQLQTAVADSQNDGEILQRFKKSAIDRRHELVSWVKGSDLCNASHHWRGVTCEPSVTGSLSIHGLDLHGLHLSGSVSSISHLGALASLDTLDLSDNFFSGPIPDTLSSLTVLSELRLQRNVFNGSIPVLPTKLKRVLLQNNELTGDIGNLESLLEPEELDIHGNNLTGGLDNAVVIRWTDYSLYILDVSDNQLEGHLPPALAIAGSRVSEGDLGAYYMNLSLNRFTGRIPPGSWRIETLDFSRNQLNGSIPSGLLHNDVTSYLNCSSNYLTGIITPSNEDGTSCPGDLRSLDLSHNLLEGPIPETLVTPTKSNLSILDSLEVLNLQSNRLSGSIDHVMAAKFVSLKELRLSRNNFTVGASLDQLTTSHFPSLEVLDLSSNLLQGAIPPGLSGMPYLKEIRLESNSLTGEISATRYSSWKNLEVLDVRHNFLHWSEGDPGLRTIFDSYVKLRELRLGSNNLSRTVIPTSSSKRLDSLEILDLSDSNLEGFISPDLFNNRMLPNLRYLDLSNNHLQGEVPGIFTLMPNLVYLNLSNNKLSGPLPSFLINPFLSNPSFFSSNPGLCGGPLPPCPTKSKGIKIWEVIGISLICVIVSGGSCLSLGWIWRWKVDARQRKRDADLIAALLDRETAAIMPLRDLKKATENFSETYKIGEGGFGTVYMGTLENGTSVAIKKSTREGTNEDKCRFLSEVKILSQVQHRNLVQLLGCCLANKICLLVFEYIPNGSLQEHLQRRIGNATLSWRQRLQIAVQTADALDHLHSGTTPPIHHLNVKSANILVDEKLNAKVADFGIFKLTPASELSRRQGMGRLGYVDPESRKSSSLSGKSDVYAYGVVLFELLSARPAIDHTRYDGEASLAKRGVTLLDGGRLEEIIDPALSETFLSVKGKESMVGVARVAAKCLNPDSRHRPLMKEVSRDLQTIWRFHYEPASLDVDDDQFATSVLERDVPWNFAGCAGASGTSFRSPG
ncbi:hypothetical protein Mapa_008526 [Marchantia paleacea]|nr:hypothetical protein Mapa_008526 [Marchantia paleacea]